MLFDTMLQRLAGTVFVDVCFGGQDIADQLMQRGLLKQRSLTRMSLGQQIIRTSDMVFAIAARSLGERSN
jgi:hypothetical protein